MVSILDNIHGHEDLIHLTDAERAELCDQIRKFIVSNVSKTGGHLASNLGVVELSVALETVFDTNVDRLVFDVGHQSYIHKLLTNRQADFAQLRQYGGMSGFPKPSESNSDAFVAGHASSSVSIALGMARARRLTGEDYNVIALIGDGAATGGMAYEALNDAGDSKERMIVILNDNEMSIDRNVGSIAKHLYKLRMKSGYFGLKKFYRVLMKRFRIGRYLYHKTHNLKERIKRNFFRDTIFEYMGFEYIGPVDGHDLPELIRLLGEAKQMNKPVLLHVLTHKGHGFGPAEEDPSRFHGIGQFDPQNGRSLSAKKPTFSDAFGEAIVALAQSNPKLCAVTAAMPGGTGLLGFKNQFPERLYDVGIAEEHAVSMAGGLAKQGAVPVVAIYSTFLQRAYDQILQDICLLNLHVVLAVDRAGLVGDDGPTHHGVFDVGYLRQAPGMTVLCPVSLNELKDMLSWAVQECSGPVAVRYPRGGNGVYCQSDWDPSSGVVKHCSGEDVTIISYGTVANNAIAAAEILRIENINATVLRLTKVKPFDMDGIVAGIAANAPVVIVEEACAGSGIREALSWQLSEKSSASACYGIDLGEDFVPHGAQSILYEACGLDAKSIAGYIRGVIRNEE